MSSPVSFAEHEKYCLITLDDGKANAVSFALLDGFNAALDQADGTGKPVLIKGREGKFSAGFDLNVMGQGGEPMLNLLRGGASLSQRLLSFDTPVVLQVTGHALAMGALLLLSADYRIGVRGPFKLGLNEVAIGMTLPWFGIELVKHRLAWPSQERAINLAEIHDPDSAVTVGYLDEAVDTERHDTRAIEVAEHFSTLNMDAHKGSKLRTRASLLEALEQAIQRELG